MKKWILKVLASSLAFLVGCREQHNSEQLTLNAGQKWEVNDEMKPYVIQSEDLVKNYTGESAQLAAELKDLNAALIKSCTMDDESHVQLHNWLHPHLELVKTLEETSNREDAERVVVDLKNSFATYHQYFE